MERENLGKENMEKENMEERQAAQIWISVPGDHTKLIISIVAAGVMALLGILIVGGYEQCITIAMAMLTMAVLVHFLLQRRITLSKLIYYYDRGKLFLISLNKRDKKLDAYLHGQLAAQEQPSPEKTPAEILEELTNQTSVIWSITQVLEIEDKKGQPDNKKYMVLMLFDLFLYPYKTSAISVMLYQKRFENFEGLMQILWTMRAQAKAELDKISKKNQHA